MGKKVIYVSFNGEPIRNSKGRFIKQDYGVMYCFIKKFLHSKKKEEAKAFLKVLKK
jgi:hypothetical protein